jgi:hypothetical protein
MAGQIDFDFIYDEVKESYGIKGNISFPSASYPQAVTADEIASQQSRVLMVIKFSMIDAINRLPGINGSTLIYSLWSGYLKEPSMERFVRFIKENGIRMVHHHTSGHGDVETLQRLDRVGCRLSFGPFR